MTAYPRGFKARCENIALSISQELGRRPHAPISVVDLADYLGVLLITPRAISGMSERALRVSLKEEKDRLVRHDALDRRIYSCDLQPHELARKTLKRHRARVGAHNPAARAVDTYVRAGRNLGIAIAQWSAGSGGGVAVGLSITAATSGVAGCGNGPESDRSGGTVRGKRTDAGVPHGSHGCDTAIGKEA